MVSRALVLALLPLSALAHFKIVYPSGRGFDETNIVNFPCGGFDTPDTNRTSVSIKGPFPIQLSMEHTSVKGAVYMALGNDPSTAYSIQLKQTFQETGPDNFCIGDVVIPSNLNITAGMNATIQVVTNGDPTGGLYQVSSVATAGSPIHARQETTSCLVTSS
jgi:hypothetical protein